MKKYLKKLPKEVQDLIYLAGNIASDNNMSVYLVGGFVRDLILGVKNLDLDIVVEGDGILFAEDFARRLKTELICHRKFGTATVTINPQLKIDIATAREEFYPQPAQLPEVRPGSLRDDLLRRDFTINAMAISISNRDFGQLIDLFGGKADLRNKKIRILHNLSFIDDPTRILRAIRFEKRYNFRIESQTLKLLKGAVKQKMLEKVQPHRLRDELILILKEEHLLRQIKRIEQLVKFNFINPRLSVSQKTYTLLKSLEKQIRWFRQNFSWRRLLDTWLIYFMGLIEPLNIEEARLICQRFALRRGEEKRILAYKKIKRKTIQELSRAEIRPSRIFGLLEPLSYEVILILKAKFSRQSGIPQNAGKNKNIQKHIEDFLKIYNGMRTFISGDDLKRLGIMPSPYYQKIFTQVLNAKLNGSIKTREEELALIKKLIKNR
jgi:tRNA nucleotidyltransferase (CCA-adding enzyme)